MYLTVKYLKGCDEFDVGGALWQDDTQRHLVDNLVVEHVVNEAHLQDVLVSCINN